VPGNEAISAQACPKQALHDTSIIAYIYMYMHMEGVQAVEIGYVGTLRSRVQDTVAIPYLWPYMYLYLLAHAGSDKPLQIAKGILQLSQMSSLGELED
jgi:hypothetical protein